MELVKGLVEALNIKVTRLPRAKVVGNALGLYSNVLYYKGVVQLADRKEIKESQELF